LIELVCLLQGLRTDILLYGDHKQILLCR
jgi:hypothetical protein